MLTVKKLWSFYVAVQWKFTCWLTVCYWTLASDSSLRKIHLRTLNNIFVGLKQSECVQTKGRNNGNRDIFEVAYEQCTILQHHGQHHWSTKAGDKKPHWFWRDSCLTELTVSVILCFCLRQMATKAVMTHTVHLFFGSQNSENCHFVDNFCFY